VLKNVFLYLINYFSSLLRLKAWALLYEANGPARAAAKHRMPRGKKMVGRHGVLLLVLVSFAS
jgi:hypothetical protein